MFGKGIKLFDLFGFTVRLDFSWLIIGLLITWSLAEWYFPQRYDDLPTRAYWLLGVAGAVGLFISIVWHELCHSLVARQFGLPMGGITLFIFGGVAEMSREPPNPKAEFLMALAGPVSSVVLGVVFLAVTVLSRIAGLPDPLTGAFAYLGMINLVLAAFNLFPGFPLDGGRLLRAALWQWKDNIRWATRVAARIGSGFGIVLIVLGVLQFIQGVVIGGVWYCLIGLFLRNAAKGAYQQLLLREALGGEKVEHFMTENPVTVDPNLTLEELVENYIYRYHHKMFPVIENDRLLGCITTERVKEVPRTEWDRHTVEEYVMAPSESTTIAPNADAMNALSRMNRSKASRLLVVDDGTLRGIITLKDLLDFFGLKVELEEEDDGANDMLNAPGVGGSSEKQ